MKKGLSNEKYKVVRSSAIRTDDAKTEEVFFFF